LQNDHSENVICPLNFLEAHAAEGNDPAKKIKVTQVDMIRDRALLGAEGNDPARP
jgi:hypothetical protein